MKKLSRTEAIRKAREHVFLSKGGQGWSYTKFDFKRDAWMHSKQMPWAKASAMARIARISMACSLMGLSRTVSMTRLCQKGRWEDAVRDIEEDARAVLKEKEQEDAGRETGRVD